MLGWCWMSNHVHLVAVPRRENSLSRLVMRVHSAYAQDFNRRYRRSGPLWHSRFYSCALGPDHLYAALLYVDRNPVRAGMTGEATAQKGRSPKEAPIPEVTLYATPPNRFATTCYSGNKTARSRERAVVVCDGPNRPTKRNSRSGRRQDGQGSIESTT